LGRQSPNEPGSGRASPTLTPARSGIKNFAVGKSPSGRNYAHDDERSAILASVGFASTSGWLFEGQTALR
jgi:hypothetical protein